VAHRKFPFSFSAKMTELLLVACRVSEVVTSAIRRALISVGIDIPKSFGNSLIIAENKTVSALLTELWRTLERAQRNARGVFFFFFQPTEVVHEIQKIFKWMSRSAQAVQYTI
jgi:hypothetical protein